MECLRTEIPKQQFDTWILPIRAELEAKALRLFAPNHLILDWVRGKFLPRIREILAELGDDEVQITLEIMSATPSATNSGNGATRSPWSPSVPVPPREDAGNRAAPVGNGKRPPAVSASSSHRPLDRQRTGANGAGARTRAAQQRIGADFPREALPPHLQDKMYIVEGKLSHRGVINPENTFKNFIVGKSNQLARAAAMQVASNPGDAYNPLFIYGGVGLGKTHLMQAVGNQLLGKKPRARVVYLHSETFVGTMVTALQLNAIGEFKRFYRSVDALLIDDIQFFAGKERTQEEFFHTFNALLESGQQIILSCDRFHKEITGVEERLKSRFGSGLTVQVEPPELETRAAILCDKARQCRVDFPYEVALHVARRLRSNVRELEGALKRVIALSNFRREAVHLELVKEALRDLFAVQDKLVTIDNIQRSVAEYYKIKMADMLSRRRNRSIARPRQMAMSLAKELTNHSLPEIGDAFGGRDHTTVLHACRQISKLRETSPDMEEDHKNLLRSLSS